MSIKSIGLMNIGGKGLNEHSQVFFFALNV